MVMPKTAIYLIAILILSGCQEPRPENGPKDGQFVYLKANCDKYQVTGWATFLYSTGRHGMFGSDITDSSDGYMVIDKYGNLTERQPREIVINPKDCVDWTKP